MTNNGGSKEISRKETAILFGVLAAMMLVAMVTVVIAVIDTSLPWQSWPVILIAGGVATVVSLGFRLLKETR